MQPAPSHAQGRDPIALRRDRKRRVRRAQKDKLQAKKALQAIQEDIPVSKHKHLADCARARRWLHAQLLRPDRGGIDEATRKQLTGFWRRREHAEQMTTTINEKGSLEKVPALSKDAVAAWRRFEGVEEACSKADDDPSEEGGVKLDDEGEGKDEMMMYGFHGQPEPVPAEEYE